MWENNLETFKKLFSMIQSLCSIYSDFLKYYHYTEILINFGANHL